MTSFVERLTLPNYFHTVLPAFLRSRRRGRAGGGRCYVFESSALALRVGRIVGRLLGIEVERLRFRLLDVRDEAGALLRLRIPAQDLLQVRAEIMDDPLIHQGIAHAPEAPRLPMYVQKALVPETFYTDENGLWRAAQMVQVCAWAARRKRLTDSAAVCFLDRRPWWSAIGRYAAQQGLELIPVRPRFRVRAWLRQRLSAKQARLLDGLRSHWSYRRLRVRSALQGPHRLGSTAAWRRAPPKPGGDLRGRGTGFRIAVECYGHLNLDDPRLHSEVFFWNRSLRRGSDLLVTFGLAAQPLDERAWAELRGHGLGAIALKPQAASSIAVPVFLPPLRAPRPLRWTPSPASRSRGVDARWLNEQIRDYHVLRAWWSAFFEALRVRIHVSWFLKSHPAQCAMADALQERGGVMAIYQRSYEAAPSAEMTVAVDVALGLSPASAEVERQSGSVIPYHVSVGYVGDYRFPLLRRDALRIRRDLQARGARRVLGFADENSLDDERWHTGHALPRGHYQFLLERVLAEPWLGLVMKPKVPATLRKRLGPVAALLQRAQATGRCVVYGEGALQGSYPPAVAALASDLMVHGHLWAGTAGVESALAGVPTLLLDGEGWPSSPLYRLGVGRVVFTDWGTLWKACLEHWSRPGGIPGFGDWTSMLDELDPFRDGRAAERMGAFLQWLLDGLNAGLDRETVLADAAERYAAQWGKDKVTHINCAPNAGRASGATGACAGAEPHPAFASS